MAGPCTSWASADDAQALPGNENLDASLLVETLNVATEILWALSGRQFSGDCVDRVRPCAQRVGMPLLPGWLWHASWGTCGCGGAGGLGGGSYSGPTGQGPRGRACGCQWLSEITLGAYPLREITQIRIDGAVLSPTKYRIDDRRWLVRTDGHYWPYCQNLIADPATDADTFEVSFMWGQTPPASGALAAKVLGGELAKAYSGAPDCRLPERVQTLQRQGVSLAFLDPQDFLDHGRTGIYIVDLFLKSVNPRGLQRRATVYSPDIPRPVRRTATTPGS